MCLQQLVNHPPSALPPPPPESRLHHLNRAAQFSSVSFSSGGSRDGCGPTDRQTDGAVGTERCLWCFHSDASHPFSTLPLWHRFIRFSSTILTCCLSSPRWWRKPNTLSSRHSEILPPAPFFCTRVLPHLKNTLRKVT